MIPSFQLLSGLFDRMGAQAGLLKFAINSGVNTGIGYYQKIHDNVPWPQGDYFTESALITDAYGIDSNSISGTLFKNVYSSLVQDIENLLISKGGAASLDAYLTSSGLRISQNAEDVYYQCRSQHLSACNVFFPQDNIKVAKFVVSSSGVGTYTSLTPVGTGGTTAFSPGTTNYGNARMLLIPIQTMVAQAQINLQLTLQPQYPGASAIPDSTSIRILNGVTSGIQFPFISQFSTTSGFLNVSNILVAGGTVGDEYDVFAIRERETVL